MTKILGDLGFNKRRNYYLHIDLNSCFAMVEQQANPLLRNHPVGVAAYNSPRGVIVASSVEAKKLGIKTGTRVYEAKKICPKIIIVEPDANKYRFVHHKLKDLLSEYTNVIYAKSVDEFVLNLKGSPFYKRGLLAIGSEIKERIKEEIGDYLTVSIGISKNQFLAKTASNLKKPDGLDEIHENNFLDVYANLTLMDLCGINTKTLARLNKHDIHTVLEFYKTPPYKLRSVFSSILGNYWYLKLRGYEIENYEPKRRTFGHQYALPKPVVELEELTPILTKLVEKLGFRLRNKGYRAQGVHLALRYKDNTTWHMSRKTKKIMYDSKDIYGELLKLVFAAPKKPITVVSTTCFNLKRATTMQLELFCDTEKKENLTKMLDKINNRWGRFVISPATMLNSQKYIPDRIGFGNVDP
ncbi:hypothetical protein ACFL0C_00245 [Patescibacteria group bacterium]